MGMPQVLQYLQQQPEWQQWNQLVHICEPLMGSASSSFDWHLSFEAGT